MNHHPHTPGTASLVAGIALAAMAVLAAFGNLVAIESLVTPGDPARTVQDIAAAETRFAGGIVSLVIVALLDVVVAVALRIVFEPVNRRVSATAAWFRIVYAAVFLLAISQLVVALTQLGDAKRAARAFEAFELIWQAGLILFAVHLLLIGYLAYRSGFMPRVFGILLLVAGLGYLVDGFGTVLIPGYSVSIAQFTFVGEVALIFWLLIKGRRMSDDVVPSPALVACRPGSLPFGGVQLRASQGRRGRAAESQRDRGERREVRAWASRNGKRPGRRATRCRQAAQSPGLAPR